MTTFTDHITATQDPPPQGVPNPIHAADGADAAGYAGALVSGVRTYGWVAETIAKALGDTWFEDGWVDFTLRRPLFADEVLTTSIDVDDQTCSIRCTAGADQRVVLDGTAGLGSALWRDELTPPVPAPGDTPEPSLPTYDLNSVPLRQPLVPLTSYVSIDAARCMVTDDLGLSNDRYSATGQVPPYFLAARMAPLTRHNFSYGPTIHVRSQIQHCRLPIADQAFTVGAQIVDAYDRKGHWYQVLDGVITDDVGIVAQLRHHTIFRPRDA